MPDNSSLGLSKSKMETTPFFVADLTEKNCALCKMLFPVTVGDEALKYPFGRAVQQGFSGSVNLAWRSEKGVV